MDILTLIDITLIGIGLILVFFLIVAELKRIHDILLDIARLLNTRLKKEESK